MADGNWEHIKERIKERIDYSCRQIVVAAIKGIMMGKVKRRTMPNRDWYRTVRHNNEVIGHICGQGNYISTVYSAKMTPRGERV